VTRITPILSRFQPCRADFAKVKTVVPLANCHQRLQFEKGGLATGKLGALGCCPRSRRDTWQPKRETDNGGNWAVTFSGSTVRVNSFARLEKNANNYVEATINNNGSISSWKARGRLPDSTSDNVSIDVTHGANGLVYDGSLNLPLPDGIGTLTLKGATGTLAELNLKLGEGDTALDVKALSNGNIEGLSKLKIGEHLNAAFNLLKNDKGLGVTGSATLSKENVGTATAAVYLKQNGDLAGRFDLNAVLGNNKVGVMVNSEGTITGYCTITGNNFHFSWTPRRGNSRAPSNISPTTEAPRFWRLCRKTCATPQSKHSKFSPTEAPSRST
jgi:hypothetical protein